MPAETFTAKIQASMRIQVPVLLRWKYKLGPGTILKVELTRTSPFRKTRFYARLQRSGRLAIPKLVADTNELKKGDVVEATIWIEL
jgi:bifunctional DNA-binding transcriptional regulator/antitoxin component of YhaV-PrlF toxin-antitoxin module